VGFPTYGLLKIKENSQSVHLDLQRQPLQEDTLRRPYCLPPRLIGAVHHDGLRNVPPEIPKGVALGFIGGSCMMVLQHIVFLQFGSSGTACFRNIVQDDVVLITVATSAAYRLCYSSQRVQHWQQRT
jgi:hypothetical protein